MLRLCLWPRPSVKRCSGCTEEKPLADFPRSANNADGVMGWCLACNRAKHVPRPYVPRTPEQEAAHQRHNATYRERHPGDRARRAKQWRAEHPKATAAHDAVARALRNGTLVKPETCQRCPKKGRLEAHHEDYEKPLEVEWLCRRCHKKADVMELGVAV